MSTVEKDSRDSSKMDTEEGQEKPNLVKIFLPNSDDEFDEDEFNIDEEEIERECERLFPPIPPPKTSNGSDDDSLENLINMLGLTAQLEKCTRVQDSLTDTYKGIHSASKALEPLLDEAQKTFQLFNNVCRSAYQSVVLKAVEVDENGVMKTIKNTDDDVIILDDDNESTKSKEDEVDNKRKVQPKSKSENEAVPDDDLPIEIDDEVSAIGEVSAGVAVFGTKKKYSVAPTPRILPRMIPAVDKKVYAMKGSALSHWVPARVVRIEKNPRNGQLEFEVELEASGGRKGQAKTEIRGMSAKHLAFSLKTPFLLPVGARVIARFKDEFKTNVAPDHDFYAGIVAERPIPHNLNRYLIFFDDGYAQYVSVDNVLWVCESSKDVWNDVHPSSQPFIRNYLKRYPERPMVRLSKGTIVSTEWNGNWWIGRVVEVDCSLVKIHFEADNRYEWIYRGSTRLAPLYNKLKRQEARGIGDVENDKSSTTTARPRHDVHAAAHLKEAKIEYLNYQDTPGKNTQTARKSTSLSPRSSPLPVAQSTGAYRSLSNVGKKPLGTTTSTGLVEYEGRMTRVLIPKDIEGPSKYVPHTCKPSCVRFYKEDDPQTRMINPLTLPMYYGWDREVGKTPRRTIFYRAPCGRRIRDSEELHEFLVRTKYNMGIDHFCFDYAVDCFNEFIPASHHFLIADITYSKEKVPVQCCNTIDHEYPEYVEYTAERIPGKGVKMNLDPSFLSCCDCTDDCADKEKCACWRMTLEGMNLSKSEITLELGYQYRRLMDHCITGIYECNPRCSCRKTCLNRVVQHDMKWQLQIFKTSNKGWAIRPIHDIPQGAFICVYAGQLLTENGANEDGKAYGDEYLAELDYIEVCESYKEGFEADVVDPDPSRRRQRNSSEENGNSEEPPEKKSTRELFGPDEFCYIMDAKSVGNIGRYLNHSCQPNVFVQNVFVDTHDLRFPWVAFFAYKHIRAGTELTWDYNYDIGSVPGKTMYCYCGTPECRGRLL